MSEGIAADALQRYENARDRAAAARKEWEDQGGPLTIEYRNGLEGAHPLLKVLLDLEAHADRMMKSLSHRQAKPGRPVGSSSSPDRVTAAVPPKRAALKAVK